MNPPLTCADTIELLPDLALGSLAGDDRARVLDHLGACPACSTEAVELSAAVDAILQLAPTVDPPAGFESAVLARIGGPPPWWRRPRPLIAVATAVLLVAGVAFVVRDRDHDVGIDQQYVQSIRALGGKELRAAPLQSGGATWGQAFVYEGKTSWVFVSMSWDVPNGMYHVVLDRSDGPSANVARLRLVLGQGSAGMVVGDTRTVTGVRIIDPSGRTVCTATLPGAA